AILDRVKKRLGDRSDTDWTLVATTCVECGVDVSFRTGFRERAGLVNILQTAGRVNRNDEDEGAVIWDVQLRPDPPVIANPGFADAAFVLGGLFKEGRIGPQDCTEALRREIRLGGSVDLNARLHRAEAARDFPAVDELFRVIEQDTI